MDNHKEFEEKKSNVKKYYDQEAAGYVNMYHDGYKGYPANLIRLNILVDRLRKNQIKNILDIGCGTCSPMIRLLKEGFKCEGFDFAENMVMEGKIQLEKAGFDPNLISKGDLEGDLSSFKGRFDAVIASGVFPHIPNERKALVSIGTVLRSGGKVFIEFRNDLFAAFTFNRYSLNFFLNKVIELDKFSSDMRENITKFFSQRLDADRKNSKDPNKIDYTDILAQFHNPLTIEEQIFKPCNFSVNKIHFYHYHVLPPIFGEQNPDLFKEMSLKMENPSDWRGYLMASAFVVEATKND